MSSRKPIACPICPAKCLSSIAYRLHSRTHKGFIALGRSCHRCRLYFASYYSTLRHKYFLQRCKAIAAQKPQKSIKRSGGTKSVPLADTLQNMTAENVSVPSLKCRNCSKGFVKSESLSEHQKYSGSCGSEGRLACAKCHRSYESRLSLNNHERFSGSCGREPDQVCPKCGFATKQRCLLRKHMSGRGCDIALKRQRLDLLKRSTLDMQATEPIGHHSPTARQTSAHPGKRKCGPVEGSPHVCHKCNRQFSRSCDLSEHSKYSNTCGEEPGLSCPKCKQAFQSRQAMKNHLRYNDRCGEADKLACPKCSFMASNRWNLRDHLKSSRGCTISQRRKELEDLISESKSTASREKTDESTSSQVHQMKEDKPKSRSSNSSSSSTNGQKKGPHVCNKCSKQLSTAKGLADHLRYNFSCGDRPILRCPKCPYVTRDPWKLKDHTSIGRACQIRQRRKDLKGIASGLRISVAAPQNPVSIETALGQSSSSGIDVDSAAQASATASAVSKKCDNTPATVPGRADHEERSKSCGDEARYSCPKCGHATRNLWQLRRHMESDRGCAIILQRRQFEYVMKTGELHHNEPAKDQFALANQEETENPSEMSTFKSPAEVRCPKCGKKFCAEKYLKQHLRHSAACGPGLKTECQKCGKEYSTRLSLQNHLRFSGTCGEEGLQRCPKCTYTNKNLYRLKIHLKACVQLAQDKKEMLDERQ